MKEDEVWQFFVESLWRYQYVQKPCPLTPEWSHTLYYETQGITDFAIKVYMLAQLRAITTGLELVTKSIIQSVTRDNLRLATPVLSALKSGNLEKLLEYDDVHPIDIEPFVEEATERLLIKAKRSSLPETQSLPFGTENSQNAQGKQQQLVFDSPRSELVASIDTVVTPASPQTSSKSKKRRKKTATESDLPEIVSSSADLSDLKDYEALQQAGYIRPATEFQE
jgi:hypothetical protein